MKAGLLSLAALSAVAIAQPHNHRRHQHAKKQAVEYDVVTETSYATETAPPAVVYVDGNGNPTYTSYGSQQPAATSAPAPAPAAYSAPPAPPAYSAPAPAPESSSAPAPPAYSAPASSQPPAYSAPASSAPAYSPPASSAASSAAPAQSSSSSGSSGSDSGSSGYGIVYSPYNSDNSCKSQDQVNKDFESLNGYGWVRIYGTDCDQASTVISAASSKGMKVFAGIYDIDNASIESSVQAISDAVNGDWSKIQTVSVGNEGINNGQYSLGDISQAVPYAKSCLQAKGYNGDVVTVDTFVAIIANPGLCDVGDFVAANCHAFFDGGKTAEQAGEFVLEQAQRVSDACGGKNTMITESGWPSKGNSNKLAVPSPENQKAAISSLKQSFSSNIILFSAFNDYWKQNNAGTFDAEQYWGIYGDCPSQ